MVNPARDFRLENEKKQLQQQIDRLKEIDLTPDKVTGGRPGKRVPGGIPETSA